MIEGDGKEVLSEKVALLISGEVWIAYIVDNRVDALGELEFLIDFFEKDRLGVEGQFPTIEEEIDFFVFGGPACQNRRFHGILLVWAFVGKISMWFRCNLFDGNILPQTLSFTDLTNNFDPNVVKIDKLGGCNRPKIFSVLVWHQKIECWSAWFKIFDKVNHKDRPMNDSE